MDFGISPRGLGNLSLHVDVSLLWLFLFGAVGLADCFRFQGG